MADLNGELDVLCRDRVPAAVISVNSGVVGRARFSGYSENLLTLEMVDLVQESSLSPLTELVVVFHIGNRGYVFLASVKDYHHDTRRLMVLRPREVASESRSAFRVPIRKGDADLTVRLQDGGGKQWSAQAEDISLTGILLRFPASATPEWEVGRELTLLLSYRGEEVDLIAVVRRRDGQCYGLFFPDSLQGGDLNPPAELRRIVLQLEQRWLQWRVRS